MDRPFPIITMSFTAILLLLLTVDFAFMLLDVVAFFAEKAALMGFANFAAYGTPNQAPVMDITAGLTAEVPNFMRWVAKVGSEAL